MQEISCLTCICWLCTFHLSSGAENRSLFDVKSVRHECLMQSALHVYTKVSLTRGMAWHHTLVGMKSVFKKSLSVQVCMQLPIQQSGICNAIAFWFELDLDEQTQLSTSPYCGKVLLYSIGHS